MQEINFTSAHKFLISALQQPWTAIYTKVIAIALLYGAMVHVGNILGLTGTSWLATPLIWRSLDIVLLIFDIVTAIALGARISMVYLVAIWRYFTAANFALYPIEIAFYSQARRRSST